MSVVKMIVGLGNPGDEYRHTRHNIGFRLVDALAKSLGIEVRKRRFGARFGMGELGDNRLILLKPWRFMNRSGEAVATAVGFYKLGLDDLLVVTDDMSLPAGRIRIRARGSAGGHNGLADIIEKLGTNQFGRLRIGIGDCGSTDAADYVLSRPGPAEAKLLKEAVSRACKAVLCWAEHGIDEAMNRFNAEQTVGEQ